MPQRRALPGSWQDWLARARGDLALACAPLPEGAYYEDLCYHAQQAAEKAVKALYRNRGLVFKYTHDLDVLLDGLRQAGLNVPDAVRAAATLTGYAWEARYPGVDEPVTAAEYQEAVRLAETVVEWVEGLLAEGPE